MWPPLIIFLITELRIKVASCYFKEEDRMIRDKSVSSCTGKMKQLLLRDDDLDLKKNKLKVKLRK